MLKRITFLFVSLVLTVNINAQDKLFTLDDVISGGENYTSFYPEYLKNLKWIEGTDRYSYTVEDEIIIVDAKSKKEKSRITLNMINEIASLELVALPRHTWLSTNKILLHLKQSKTIINLKTKGIESTIKFPKGASDVTYQKDANRVAFTINNNLYIATKDLAKIAVTNDINSDIKNGQTYHRNEFGIGGGIFWSSKGNLLAFARKDESMVENYPLVNIESREASLENIKYPMAGMKSHEVTIGVYNPKTGSTTFLQTGEPKEQYLTNVAWSPDESTVYIAVLNRDQNHMKFNAYNAITGEFVATLFEEKSDKYVEPQHAMVWMPNNDSQFIWQSLRDGHNHLYIYNIDGKLEKQITKGDWDITTFQGFDQSGKYLFYTSTEKSPIERHTYRLDLTTGDKLCLTKEEGTHGTSISSSGNYIIDNWSNTSTPRKIDVINVSKGTINNILTADNPYKDYQLGETQIFTIQSGDGKTELYSRMILPPNFDKYKKYPVIVYVYGGPHAQLVHNRWMGGARMWQHYMAQKGYIAFTLDNRGSAGRGRDFEQVIHRNLGQAEMADQMKGIEYLKDLPFVDDNRIGVHGWSYGGFMTTSLMLNHPETFKVGVAGGPVIDWKYYEIMYGERYMDKPQENPEGYQQANLLNQVSNLEGRLLLIHGAIDPTVVWQHSLAFVRECVKEGVQLDYFPYPRHEHNVRGKDRVHLMQKVSMYFDDFLK